LHLSWQHPQASARLMADLRNHSFTVYQSDHRGDGTEEVLMSFE
jgi:alpha-beta hydrolase superfamily lysophospholipase